MKNIILYISIAFFSIFVGSQIAEGVLLVPYWQSLSPTDFYAYYQEFGPSIARFYTILTILAALIPVFLSVYCRIFHPKAFKFAVGAAIFAALFIATFYIYFKGVNEVFIQGSFSDLELKNELITWSTWHWGRIGIEILSLLFLILAIRSIHQENV